MVPGVVRSGPYCANLSPTLRLTHWLRPPWNKAKGDSSDQTTLSQSAGVQSSWSRAHLSRDLFIVAFWLSCDHWDQHHPRSYSHVDERLLCPFAIATAVKFRSFFEAWTIWRLTLEENLGGRPGGLVLQRHTRIQLARDPRDSAIFAPHHLGHFTKAHSYLQTHFNLSFLMFTESLWPSTLRVALLGPGFCSIQPEREMWLLDSDVEVVWYWKRDLGARPPHLHNKSIKNDGLSDKNRKKSWFQLYVFLMFMRVWWCMTWNTPQRRIETW